MIFIAIYSVLLKRKNSQICVPGVQNEEMYSHVHENTRINTAGQGTTYYSSFAIANYVYSFSSFIVSRNYMKLYRESDGDKSDSRLNCRKHDLLLT